MPRIKSYTAPWLAQGPGQRLFASAADTTSAGPKRHDPAGPRRTIARRGTEVFVAIGKELRWADLAYLKENWTAKEPNWRASRIKRENSEPFHQDDALPTTEDAANAQGFRVRECPISYYVLR